MVTTIEPEKIIELPVMDQGCKLCFLIQCCKKKEVERQLCLFVCLFV